MGNTHCCFLVSEHVSTEQEILVEGKESKRIYVTRFAFPQGNFQVSLSLNFGFAQIDQLKGYLIIC